ncbi:hypothetical protein A3C87_02340 [Candidatus Kaiserbacteria bacterium RIFCSPHIGHO2_02_FULL_49_34]|uniref:DNA 3'-5' helicase n=1 Tax=Candidatus Kaiserbacteria bacterium RIFCSPHIGHO2_02_FULL_49_34 TaxID=1798491 RepID=A0A1F6DLZ3_9BACT|nr:MAG: hypothetical protein A3C87_02340 [Candidatus Kaiserbacteria bacterium RIFCSPHIGHO2_02_FULL_49_34]
MKKGKDDAAFLTAYGKLNASQKMAVDTVEGPVMVIAGPGTGKTQILALRIANILRLTDTKPENILALTFTDAGSHAMRERLSRYIGEAAYHVPVHTFHSFAGECIRKYPDAYPRIIGGRPASDIEKVSIMEDIINGGQFKLLRPHGDPLYYVKKIPSAISNLKKEYITSDIFSERIARLEDELEDIPQFHEKGAHKGKERGEYRDAVKRIAKLRELLLAYKLYQAVLDEKRLYDFEDMIVETVRALSENEDMLRDLQETYQYLLADEHQDVNQSQNKILELLAGYHESPNIFVVGDEKQAIYRFQGASLQNFLFFAKHFKDTKEISLTENYRSTQTILDAAHSLVETDDELLSKLRVPLTAAGKLADGASDAREFDHEDIEDEWVLERVQDALREGTAPAEIAIIARKNSEVEHYAGLLRRHSIAVRPSAESDILEHPIMHAVEVLMRATVRADDTRALYEVLHAGYFNIPTSDLVRLFAGQTWAKPLATLMVDEAALRELHIAEPEKIMCVATLFTEARKREVTDAPHHVVEFLVTESGFLAHVVKNDPAESVRVLRRIYDDIEAMVVRDHTATLSAVVRQFAYRREHGLPLIAPFIGNDADAVQVMTAHKSKGLEFEVVIIPHVHDKAWGKPASRDLFKLPFDVQESSEELDGEDDERRLLYVAMTRAKRMLHLSHSRTNREGKLLAPSRFLGQIDAEKLLPITTSELHENFDPAKLFGNPPQGLRIDPQLVRELFLKRGFSVTHLNNYLKDPWYYFYRNLLKIPEPRGTSLLFGEAVHAVLEQAVQAHANGEWPTESEVSQILKRALERMPITKEEYPRLHERAFEALLPYLDHLKATIGVTSRPELSISTILKTGDQSLPEIKLTGNLDRVDYDTEGNIVRVLDYKTGKPKSENEVLGNTQSSDGGYHRQLVFYALLIQLHYEDMPLPPAFTLSFVERKERAQDITEYTFTINQDDINTLKTEIIRVANEIAEGKFFDTPPVDPSVIPYR